LVANSLKPLADAILAEQLALLKPSQRQRLPNYGTPLVSITHEKLALITLGKLLNAISSSEFEEGLAPGVTAVAYEIGQRSRLERIFDRLCQREVDISHELRSRNRNRNARQRAEELARKLDDDDDWAKNYRSFHLGDKLIVLAVHFAHFDGRPIFELKTVRENNARGTKTTQRIALTTAASDRIATHDSTLASMSSPVYLPMVVPPRPWGSLSGGGYLATPLKLLKRQATRRAQQLLENADLSPVFSPSTRCRVRLTVLIRILTGTCVTRGMRRAYPVPQLINPQSDDVGRSLLEFAEGKPLGERGAYWLAIHVANCYWKRNKVSFDKRLTWVHQHEQEIIAFADDPLRVHRFWDEADKPWTFLAACKEWKRYKEEGPEFRSHLPVDYTTHAAFANLREHTIMSDLRRHRRTDEVCCNLLYRVGHCRAAQTIACQQVL
jgi:DNA-directed RNA polymerase